MAQKSNNNNKKSDFDRSEFMKELHKEAKLHKSAYEQLYGENKVKEFKYSDFMKKKDPLVSNIVLYRVSYQMSYTGREGNGMYIEPETFEVFAIKSPLTDEHIYNMTKESIYNMRNDKGDTFPVSVKSNLIEPNLEVNVEPRGMEQSKIDRIERNIIENLVTNKGIAVKGLDTNVKVSPVKNNKKKSSYNYKMSDEFQKSIDEFL